MSFSTSELVPYDGPHVYPQAIALSFLASLACVLSTPPLVLQIKNKNLPIAAILISNILMNLQNATNPVIWPNDDTEAWFSGIILCDIEAKLQVGLSAIPPMSATCICRQLATILSAERAVTIHATPSSIRKRLAFEVTLCILLPISLMSVHILVQPWRYSIYGISGCQFCLHRSFLTWVLFLVWQIPISLLGIAYSVLTIVRLIRHHRQVSVMLTTANTSKARFALAFAFATISAVVYIPLALYLYMKNPEGNMQEWSWESVHPPSWDKTIVKIKSDGEAGLDRWLQVASGYVLFAVFGLGGDARTMYKRWAHTTGLQKTWSRIWSTNMPTDEQGSPAQRQPPPMNRQRARPPSLYDIDDDLDIALEDLTASSPGDGCKQVGTDVDVKSPEMETLEISGC